MCRSALVFSAEGAILLVSVAGKQGQPSLKLASQLSTQMALHAELTTNVLCFLRT